jgi:hypothetical protein
MLRKVVNYKTIKPDEGKNFAQPFFILFSAVKSDPKIAS